MASEINLICYHEKKKVIMDMLYKGKGHPRTGREGPEGE
jgi:hypothetical protein